MKDASDTQTPDLLEPLDTQPEDKKKAVPKASPNAQNISVNPTMPTPAQVQEQAQKVAKKQIAEGFALLAVHEYTAADGQPLYWKIRAKHPDTGEKFIRAFHWTGSAFKASEPDHPDSGKPLYGLQHIAQADPAAVVWITEGEQKADALNALGLVATTTGGSSSANKSDWQPLAGRPVAIWPDHDEPGQKYAAAVARILQGLACTVSVVNVASIQTEGQPMPPKGDVVDWLAMREAAGLTTSAADVEGLPRKAWGQKRQATPTKAEREALFNHLASLAPDEYETQRRTAARTLGWRVESLDTEVDSRRAAPWQGNSRTAGRPKPPAPTPDPDHPDRLAPVLQHGGGYFETLQAGLFFVEQDKEGHTRKRHISGPLQIIAKTRNSNGQAWGRLLQWKDDEGRTHEWAMPMGLTQGDGLELRRELADNGLWISPETLSRQLLTAYIGRYPVEQFAECVERVGWHGSAYVLPDRIIGPHQHRMVYQTPHGSANPIGQAGTLEDWRAHVAAPCAGNSRLVFALSCAFAAPLMEIAQAEAGGFHLRGSSASGKSTAQLAACSVWGRPDTFKRTWRATANGLEAVAALHNDGLLVLDEIREADPRHVGQTVYMLGNGQPKQRMTKGIAARAAPNWRVLFLSSGEEALADIMASAGQRVQAGQEIRLADIPADAGAGMGIFENLHHYPKPNAFAEGIKRHAAACYGVAGLHWLEYLTTHREALQQRAEPTLADFVGRYVPTGADSQAHRVARRFALVALAGELATDAGLTGWPRGTSLQSAARCYADWLEAFGGIGNREERAMLAQVRQFFEAHGTSRFEVDNGQGERIINRAGFYRRKAGGLEYLVFPEQFKTEVCRGLDHRAVIRALLKRGFIQHDGKAVQTRVCGGERPRLYIISGCILEEDSAPKKQAAMT